MWSFAQILDLSVVLLLVGKTGLFLAVCLYWLQENDGTAHCHVGVGEEALLFLMPLCHLSFSVQRLWLKDRTHDSTPAISFFGKNRLISLSVVIYFSWHGYILEPLHTSTCISEKSSGATVPACAHAVRSWNDIVAPVCSVFLCILVFIIMSPVFLTFTHSVINLNS